MAQGTEENLAPEIIEARTDPAAFGRYVWGLEAAPHHRAWLDELQAGPDRLLIVAPPGHAKSTWITMIWASWLIGINPEINIILISATAEMANAFSLTIREQVTGNPKYAEVFPGCRAGKSKWGETAWTVERFDMTNKDPTIAAVGVGGPIISRRADLILIDDPIKSYDAVATRYQRDKMFSWYQRIAETRLKPSGRVVLGMTRWHRDDIARRLMDSGEWESRKYPALNGAGEPLWPEMFSAEYLEAVRRRVGSRTFACHYMGDPQEEEGAVFKEEWFDTRFVEHPELVTIGQSWDTPLKGVESGSWAVCVTGGRDKQNRLYVLDVWRGRPDAPGLARQIVSMYERWRPKWVMLEDTAAAAVLAQLGLQTEAGEVLPIVKYQPTKDKVSRANAVSPYCEGGNVYLPESASWLGDFLDELTSFPHGEYDDQVDSFTQWLNYIAGQGRLLTDAELATPSMGGLGKRSPLHGLRQAW